MALALTALHIALMVIAAAVFVAAGVKDAMSYRIPNYLCGILLALFPFFVATAPRQIDWHQNLGVFALVALSGFAMFLGNLVGAGDVKLLSVASLWAGPHLIAVLLVVTGITGGLLSLLMAFIVHKRNEGQGEEKEKADIVAISKFPIPYGIAISAGGLVVLGFIVKPILLPG